MKSIALRGSIVALVTPFKNGKIDESALRDLVEFQVKNGTSGIVPCGTTGEGSTLSDDEQELVIKLVVKATRGNIPVIAGTGTNNTEKVIHYTTAAKSAGADAVLIVAPYYNKPTQKGLYLHYEKISQSVDIPIVLYNIPSRTGVNIEPETLVRLASIKNIIGIKEASGNLEQISRIIDTCPKEFAVLSGDDALTFPIMAIGGVGIISTTANIVPQDVASLCNSMEQGNLQNAREMHYKLLPLVKALFLETNPIPIKTALSILGMIQEELRLPLSAMSEENVKKLKIAMKSYGFKFSNSK